MPTICERGYALIKEAEGLRLRAYPDPASGGAPWTIGYGHTGAEVHEGQEITAEEAETLLRKDITELALRVASSVTVPVNDNQFSALMSFTYNLGVGKLRGSTLLRKLNAGDSQGAADEFLRWTMPGSSVHAGLLARRQAERALFLLPETVDA